MDARLLDPLPRNPQERPKMDAFTRPATAALPLLCAGVAAAHPSHDASAHAFSLLDGLVHLLTQPDHLLLLAGAAAVGVAGARAWRARRRTGKS
jgi:hydrogenase/urease accessory protein HupE